MEDLEVSVRKRYRYSVKLQNNYQRYIDPDQMILDKMEKWCQEHLEIDSWDRMYVRSINHDPAMEIFRFDSDDDRALFALTWG